MIKQNAFPLSWPNGWPRCKSPKASRFGRWNAPITVAKAIDAIWNELRILRADRIVISTNIPLKRDGFPYSDRREPADRGAAVYFRFKGKDTAFACDKWNTVADNLWAIAKTIEATRGIERWGSGNLEQAFAGYIALVERTEADCWETLKISPDATEQQILDAYRREARAAHPDNGGSTEAFVAITRAKDIAIGTLRGRQ